MTRGPIAKKTTVRLKPSARVSATFDKLGTVLFAQRETLKIRVDDPQRRETRSRSYPVIFALG